MGFFHVPEETADDLSRYLNQTYAFLPTCGRLSFRPLRDIDPHTIWRSDGPISAKHSAVSDWLHSRGIPTQHVF